MAVAYSGETQSASPTTGTEIATPSITVSGTAPVLLIGGSYTGVASNVLTGVTFGGSGTVTLVKVFSGSGGAGSASARSFVYCVVAPSGSGAVTATFSSSVVAQLTVSLFTGASQTDPCPVADTATDATIASPITVTAPDVTADDGCFGIDGHTTAGNCSGVTPEQTYLNSTTDMRFQAGYHLGAGDVDFALSNLAADDRSAIAVRIVSGDAVVAEDDPLALWENEILALRDTQYAAEPTQPLDSTTLFTAEIKRIRNLDAATTPQDTNTELMGVWDGVR